MAHIEPFAGVRPLPELAGALASPPHQRLDAAAARQLLQDNPLSFLRVSRSEAALDAALAPTAPEVYAQARQQLDKLLAEGLLLQDASPCLYLYHCHWEEAAQVALIAALPVDTPVALPPLDAAEAALAADRAAHIRAVEAHTSLPVLTYPATRTGELLLGAVVASRQAAYDFFSDDGRNHTLYVIDDADDIEAIASLFEAVPSFSVAAAPHLVAAARQAAREEAGSAKDCRRFPALLLPVHPRLGMPADCGFLDALVLHLL